MSQLFTIAINTIKRRKISLIVYVVLGLALLWMYVALFPAFKDQNELISQAYQNLPESFAAAFNINQLAFSTLEGFLATEHFSFVWPLLVIFLTVGYGAIPALEIEKGTIELVLAKPLSRLEYIGGEFLAALASLIIFGFSSTFVVAPLAKLHRVSFSLNHIWAVTAVGTLFGLAILSVSFLVASFFKEKSKVFFTMGGVLLVMYVINILARLKDALAFLKYFSFFHYFAPDIVTKGTIPIASVAFFVTVAIIALAVGAWRFNTKDIPV